MLTISVTSRLQIMQTTVADMHLDCVEFDLVLAHNILNKRKDALTDPTRKVQYETLRMNQARFEGITASMIGKADEAKDKILRWLKLLGLQIISPNLPDDSRTLPFAYLEIAMCKLRREDADESGAFTDFQLARNSVDRQMGVGVNSFKYMLPHVLFALFITHYQRSVRPAMSILDDLLSERGQLPDLIFDDMTSLE